jgi:hypothetical protein
MTLRRLYADLGERQRVAEASLAHLEALGARSPTAADQTWLSQLQAVLGAPQGGALSPLDPGQRAVLRDTLKVLLAASAYRPYQVALGGGELEVHNREIADRLRFRYTRSTFLELVSFAEDHHVFDLQEDPRTGLVRACGVSAEENREMGERQWVTDTVRLGDLQRERSPQGWRRALLTLSRFYTQPAERAAFARAIERPETFREGTASEGVAHIFDPRTLQRDPGWFNNGRLESHGLALRAIAETVVAGPVWGESWGFTDTDLFAAEALEAVAETLSQLAQYFDALDYPTAPSVGPWEETRLDGGLAWDTEAVRAGLAALRDLLFDPAYDANARVARVRAANRARPHRLATVTDLRRLDALIDRGRARVVEAVTGASTVRESTARPIDSASTFIAASNAKLAGTPLADVEQHYRLLDTLAQHLVRRNGMIRYAPFEVALADGGRGTSPDSYLCKNYWVALDRDGRVDLEWRRRALAFGSKDASDPEVFMARSALATADTEAEWFMVSDLSRGYGVQVAKLLGPLAREGRAATTHERALIDVGLRKQTEAINRAYARITGEGSTKSNGKPAPAFAVPEAYEAVSALDSSTRYLPGADTPLSWAAASLYAASRQLRVNLEACERLVPP